MKTVSIKGKNYIPVNERLKYFREHLPAYSLRTELVLVDAEQALIKAIIRDEKDRIVSEGTSYERADNKSSMVNITSHVENAETSAWGRALGNLGIGIDASVASADEVANAVANQNKEPKPVKVITPKAGAPKADYKLMQQINDLAVDMGGTLEQVYKTYNLLGAPDEATANKILKTLQEKKKILAKEIDSKA